jgi:ferric-dicitrate binding protein FerR (iron transport regulator)
MQPHDIGDQNVERLVGAAYKPEQPDPAFVNQLHARLQAAARAMVPARVAPRPAPEAERLDRLRRRLGWAMAAAAAVVGVGLLVYALERPARNQRAQVPDENEKVTPPESPDGPRWTGKASEGMHAQSKPANLEEQRAAIGTELSTKAGERRRVTLIDGSVIYLNGGTRVLYTGDRQVKLLEGELYVEVSPRESSAKGATFVVQAPGREIEALGTRFAVQAQGATSGIVVTQGKVHVSGLESLVYAGQQLAPGAAAAVPAERASHLLDWTRDLMIAASSPLVPCSEHVGGALIAIDPNGQETRLTLRKYIVDVHIEDGFARTTIDQTYFNETYGRLEGTFYFPLPPDAVLSRLAMYVKEGNDCRLMEGGMAERDHARTVYETIMNTRRDPALLEWVDGSTFKMRVFPLEPREEKRVLLSYTQKLPSLYGTTRYRFPAGHNMEMVGTWSFQARVKHGAKLECASPSHPGMKSTTEGDDMLLTTSGQAAMLKDDVTIEMASRERQRPENEPAARFSTFKHEGAEYLMLRYRPTLTSQPKRERRDWVFLYEASANRDPLLARAQIDVIQGLLENAEHHDTFTLVTAGTRVRIFDDKARHATAANIKDAVKFLEGVQLIGALDLSQALKTVEPTLKSAQNPYLVHVGSGLATLGERREDMLAQKIPLTAKYIGVGVGKQWSRSFMKQAADRTGGYFTQINPDEPIAWRTFDLSATLNTPRLMTVRVVDNEEKVRFLTDAMTLCQGEEICSIARVEPGKGEALPKSIAFTGTLAGQAFVKELKVEKAQGEAGYLPRQWAKLELDRLLAEDTEKYKARIIALSKESYVMTPFTSLLVLETDADYARFNVDRGRKDHWAMYKCPERIPVVYEYGNPNQQQAGKNLSADTQRVLGTMVMRVPPATLRFASQGNYNLPCAMTVQECFTGAYGVIYSEEEGKLTLKTRLGQPWNLERERGRVELELLIEELKKVIRDEKTFQQERMSVRDDRLLKALLQKEFDEREFKAGGKRLPDLMDMAGKDKNAADSKLLRSTNPKEYYELLQQLQARGKKTGGGFGGGGFGPGGFGPGGPGFGGSMPGPYGSSFGGGMPPGGNRPATGEFNFYMGYYDGGLAYLPDGRIQFAPAFAKPQMQWAVPGPMMSPYGNLYNPYYTYPLSTTSGTGTDWYGPGMMPPGGFPGQPMMDATIATNGGVRIDPRLLKGLAEDWGSLPKGDARKITSEIDDVLKSLDPVQRAAAERYMDQFRTKGKIDSKEKDVDKNNKFEPQARDRNVEAFMYQRLLEQAANRASLQYDRVSFAPDPRFFRDLLIYAPGMNTLPADIDAVLESEVPHDKVKLGEIDAGARKLIGKARDLGWSRLTVPAEGRLAEYVVYFNGAGQFTWDRVLPCGLREQVVCDGAVLWHLYPEIGLGGRRLLSRYHRAEINESLPWLLPPVEDLARTADVKLLDEHSVALAPQGLDKLKGDDGKPLSSLQIVLVFADNGRLAERQLVLMPARVVFYRKRYSADGTITVSGPAADKAAATVKLNVAAAQAPELKPVMDKLVIVPMPLRTPAHVAATEPTDEKRTKDADIRMLASLCVYQQTPQAIELVAQRFLAQGDRRIGLYVLLANANAILDPTQNYVLANGKAANEKTVRFDVVADHPRVPLAHYLAYDFAVMRGAATLPLGDIGGPRDGFVQRLGRFRDFYSGWSSGTAQTGSEAAQKEFRRKTLDFVGHAPLPVLDWAIMEAMYQRTLGSDAELEKLIEKMYPTSGGMLGLAYSIRYDAALALWSSGRHKEGRERWRKLYQDTLEAGWLPPVEQNFRIAFVQSPAEEGSNYSELVRGAARKLQRHKQSWQILTLAWQSLQLSELEAANDLITMFLDGASKEERGYARLAAVQLYYQSKQWVRADNMLKLVLAEQPFDRSAALWRQAAQLATQRGASSRAVTCLEQALDLEFQDLPPIVDLQYIRTEYSQLLGQYQNVANALAILEKEPPQDFLIKVVRAADRWRSLDPDQTQACQQAARILQSVGAIELAWDYMTTPIGLKPNEASPWLGLAQSLQSEGQLDLADKAFAVAYDAEPTNAQILWDRAQNLIQAGRAGDAQAVYRALAEGSWQPRFQGLQNEARQRMVAR